jgi:hypothetical protein
MKDTERATWRDGYVLAVFAGFLAYCLGPSLIGLRTLLSVNLLSNFYPWIALHGDNLAGHQACTGDTVDAVMPGIAHVRSQLLAGHIANWQPLVGGGAPLASVPDLGLLDPLSLPYWFLPLWLAPAFVILLQIVVAAGGTFLFLRQFKLSRPASALAGLVFATSGFMVVWSNWPQTRVAALIPALFWAVERLVRRRRPVDMALIAAVVASMLLGGFPVVTGYALYMAGGYLIVRIALLHHSELGAGLRTVALAAGGLILGAVLAMVQLLPFLYFFAHSDLGYRTGDAKAGLPLSGLVTLFAPNSNGLCSFGQTDHGAVNPIELVAYIGSAALILAIAGAAFGLDRRRRAGEGRGVRGFFVAACVVIILLAWVSPSLRSVVSGLPAFADNFIGRIRSVLGFGLAVLAGIGFEWLTTTVRDRDPDRRRRWRAVWAVVVGVGSVGFGLVVLRAAHRDAFAGGYWPAVRNALVVPGILLVVAAAVLALSRLPVPPARTLAFLVIPVLVAGQAAQFFHTVLPGDSKSNFYPDTPTHQFLTANLGADRFAASSRTMYTATALYYGLRTPTGHTFQEGAWQSLLQAVDPAVMNTPTFSDFTSAVGTANVGDEPILDQMAVKYYVFPPSETAGRAMPLPVADGAVSAPAGSISCQIPGQAIRGVTFEVAKGLSETTGSGVTLAVTVRTATGTITSGRYMGTSVAAGSPVTVAVAGESLAPADGPLEVSIRAQGAAQPLKLATSAGAAACAPVLPTADGLRLVFADSGSIVYQRLTSLPRIRWASEAVALPSPVARVAALEQGIPGGEVVLDSTGQVPSGQPATVSVLTDADDTISARVSARGGGYLVVADALQQPGWAVTVDGRRAAMVAADDAMAAVYVPAGVHTVRFHYSTPGQTSGLVLSVIGVVVMVALVVAPRWRRVRRGGHFAKDEVTG